jgi:hypothetical protein
MLPSATLEDKIRFVHAIAGDDLDFLFYDGDSFSPVTINRQTGEASCWDCHGGRTTSFFSGPAALDQWAQHMPGFFISQTRGPLLFTSRGMVWLGRGEDEMDHGR